MKIIKVYVAHINGRLINVYKYKDEAIKSIDAILRADKDVDISYVVLEETSNGKTFWTEYTMDITTIAVLEESKLI
jgi:hypothetical protein